jgi:hypothetical protein
MLQDSPPHKNLVPEIKSWPPVFLKRWENRRNELLQHQKELEPMRSNLKFSDRGGRSVGSFSFLYMGKPSTACRSLKSRLRMSSSWSRCFCGHSCGLLVGALEDLSQACHRRSKSGWTLWCWVLECSATGDYILHFAAGSRNSLLLNSSCCLLRSCFHAG